MVTPSRVAPWQVWWVDFNPQLGDTTGYAMTDQVKSISTLRLKKRHSEELSAADVVTVKFALRRMIDVT